MIFCLISCHSASNHLCTLLSSPLVSRSATQDYSRPVTRQTVAAIVNAGLDLNGHDDDESDGVDIAVAEG